MPRPRRIRRIFFQPDVTYFKPAGVPIAGLNEIVLSFDELEAMRFIEIEKISQTESAKKMKISQSTFSRLLDDGRRKLAEAVINGNAIKIQGGNFKMVQSAGRGRGLGQGRGAGGRGLGGGGFAAGPDGECVCPKCGNREAHQLGQPCYQKKCPKCGSPMTRG